MKKPDRIPMTSTVKITSPNGTGRGSEITIDGVKMSQLTGIDVSMAVGQANTVRLHMIAQAQDIEIGAEITIGGAVIPLAVELALLTYLHKKYPKVLLETTGLESTERSFAFGERALPEA